MEKLPAHERAVLFLYLSQKGLPPWAIGEKGQAKVFALLAGESEEWAANALERCARAGYADREQ